MVRVPAGTSPVLLLLPGFQQIEPVQLPAYWVDRYEVTNRQFKRFIDTGGYQNKEYWKEPFFKEGRAIAWEGALAEFVDATGRPGPSTWELGDYPKGQDDYPVSGVSWYEAAAYAESVGKSLPTIYHWDYTANTSLSPSIVPLSNFSGRGPARVGSYKGMSRSGTYDLAGNVKEWCWNETDRHKRYVLGGSWDAPRYMFNQADAQAPFLRSANLGFRCVKYSSPDTLPKTVTGPMTLAARSYEREQPVSEEVFRLFLSLYSYDRTALNSAIEFVDESDENWTQQTVSFAPAYGKERALANLFLPKKFAAPYQTLIFITGADPVPSRISEYDMRLIEFIIRSGRAVLCPAFKGSPKSGFPDMTSAYRDFVINLSKELSRGIDYLETRPDIDHAKIGYYGFSSGAARGAILSALEPRLKVSVLHGGGFFQQKTRPEVDQINFAPRVRIPVLMLNGRYEFIFPKETSQDPMFRLLGTPKEHKHHAIFECGHVIPRNQVIKATLDWLDRYLGSVQRKE
jgi:hypothetical protein